MLEEPKGYFLNKHYLIEHGYWIFEVPKDGDETDTHIWLEPPWGKNGWFEKDKLMEIDFDTYQFLYAFTQDYYRLCLPLDELHEDFARHLKEKNITL